MLAHSYSKSYHELAMVEKRHYAPLNVRAVTLSAWDTMYKPVGD